MLVEIDHFGKWVQATFYAEITSKPFGKVPLQQHHLQVHELISDQGSHFKKEVATLLKKYRIRHHKSSPNHPQANGVVKVANKNVRWTIEKMAEIDKGCPNKLPFALQGHRMSTQNRSRAADRNSTILTQGDS